jgi:hypothetical protein
MSPRTAFGQHTLPGEYFTSEEIFHAERERIFQSSWLLAGHVSQLASPGSYFLFELDRAAASASSRAASLGTPSSVPTTPGPTG